MIEFDLMYEITKLALAAVSCWTLSLLVILNAMYSNKCTYVHRNCVTVIYSWHIGIGIYIPPSQASRDPSPQGGRVRSGLVH